MGRACPGLFMYKMTIEEPEVHLVPNHPKQRFRIEQHFTKAEESHEPTFTLAYLQIYISTNLQIYIYVTQFFGVGCCKQNIIMAKTAAEMVYLVGNGDQRPCYGTTAGSIGFFTVSAMLATVRVIIAISAKSVNRSLPFFVLPNKKTA